MDRILKDNLAAFKAYASGDMIRMVERLKGVKVIIALPVPPLQVNDHGRRKAEAFRRSFGLSTEYFADRNWIDAHDYLHTEIGGSPTEDMDEYAVTMLYDFVAIVGLKLRGLSIPRLTG